jgi:peptide/nickel transport system substrate-binding protein
VPPGTPRTHLARQPVPSTGPYQVAQFIPGRRLLLVRNRRFREWSRAAQPDGYPDRIDIRMDDNPSHRIQAILNGEADLALEIGSANLAPLRIRFASQLRLDTLPDTSFLSFNVQRPPFSNVLARRAVNLAIDRAAVARGLGGPGLSTPTCQVLPPNFPGYQPTAPGPAHRGTDAGTGPTSHAPARWSALQEPPGRPSTSSAPATTPSLLRQTARSSLPCARSATVRG